MSSRRDRTRAKRVAEARRAAEQRRHRVVWTTVLIAVVVLVAAGTTLAIIATQRRAESSSQYALPHGTTRRAPGLVVGAGNSTVDVYFDFSCPECKQFQTLAGSLLGSGRTRVVYHPLNVLGKDADSFSTRAAAAAGCASDAGKLPQYINAVYGAQPADGDSAPSTGKLAALGAKAGISGSAFTKCVKSQKYADWVGHVTSLAGEKGYHTPPVVLVNGKRTDATATALTAALGNAQ